MVRSGDKSSVPPSREGKVNFAVWIEPSLRESVKIAAIREGKSTQDWVVDAIQQRLQRPTDRRS
jgi:predicted HicB family RNase H-like nuclease